MGMMRSGFHNSINNDRLYNAEDMNRPYKDLVSNGVFPNPSTQLQVNPSSGMTVSVSVGGGLFGNGWAYNETPQLLTLDNSESTLTRIDAIVVRRDESQSVRGTSLIVKKGTPATNPVAPEMIHDEYIDEYCLATIKLNAGVSSITGSMITDTRPDTTVCGWVTGLIEQVDTSTLFNQWQTAYIEQFEEFTARADEFISELRQWLNDMQNILKDDTSAVARITALETVKADKKELSVTVDFTGSELENEFYYANVSADVKANDILLVAPAVDSLDAWGEGGVVCVEQGTGQLRFRSTEKVSVTANIVNLG
jgi:hypothetical protein